MHANTVMNIFYVYHVYTINLMHQRLVELREWIDEKMVYV